MHGSKRFIAIMGVGMACGSSTITPMGGESTGSTSDNAGSVSAETTHASSGLLDESSGACPTERAAIVTDIDETLTISDGEFLMQIIDGQYDPLERPGASALISAYADLGYEIIYLTARSETLVMGGTGQTAREATEQWLDAHEFPRDPARSSVILAPTLSLGDAARVYKAQALAEQQAMGVRVDYAYGNATTDIAAYAEVQIPVDSTFIIGENAGQGDTVAIDEEGWDDHAAAHLPGVPAVETCGRG